MDILDISPLLSPRLALWPGDQAFRLGSEANPADRGALRTSLHAGAHVDAPCHVVEGGAQAHELDLAPFIGPCEVVEVEVPPGARLGLVHWPGQMRAPRVLFKTGSWPDRECFPEEFNGLEPTLIARLQAQGCVLVGIDTPSVDPFESRELPAHRTLLEGGTACLEGLCLDGVAPGLYELVALPLRLEGADGSPVRAVLRRGGA